jgi:acyl-CoA dehydrogenase
MPSYTAPVKDVTFLLNDVLDFQRHGNLPGFADASPDMSRPSSGRRPHFCEEVMLPLNQVGDSEGCTRHDDASVTTPKGFKEAYKQYCERLARTGGTEEFGGQGLPYALHVAVQEYMSSANLSFMMYPGLTQGAAAAIHEHGSDEQKASFTCRRCLEGPGPAP